MKTYVLLVMMALIAVSKDSSSQSLLWKISGNGLHQSSYLYGTMHVQDRIAHQLGDSVLPAFHAAQTIGLEVIDMEAPENLLLIMKSAMMTDHKLSDYLSPDEMKLLMKKLDQQLPELKMMIENLKPFYAYAMMSEDFLAMDKEEVLDLYFEKLGRAEKKEIWGIETLEEHLGSIDGIPLNDQVKMLKDYLIMSDILESSVEEMDEEMMMRLYKEQNLEKLYQLYQMSKPSDSFHQALLVDRNIRMTGRLQEAMSEKKIFLAVGALHLAGEQGLIALLRQKGYTVEPVISSYSGPSAAEMYQEEWITYTDKNYMYKIKFPAEAHTGLDSIPMYQTTAYEPCGYSRYRDAKNKISFEVLAFGQERPLPPATYLEWLATQNGWKKKDISDLNLPANIAEYNLAPGLNKLTKVFFHQKRCYLLSLMGDTDQIHAVRDLFFDSFHYISSYEEKVVPRPAETRP